MGRVIASEMVSLDGFISRPNGELDWHTVDAEFNKYAENLLNNAQTLLFGRVTYEIMAAFWPSSFAVTNDPIIAKKMNSQEKIVFSRSLEKAEWFNTKVVREVESEVRQLKDHADGDLVILGSGSIVSVLSQAGLIDEYRLLFNPIVLGEGKPLFKDISPSLKMRLVKTMPFESGLVGLFYEPVENPIS